MRWLDGAAFIALATVLLPWIVYPLTIGALARFRRRKADHHPGHVPSVSVVIATREPTDIVLARAADCLRTTYPADRLEVVVARDLDTWSDDTTGWPARTCQVPADFPGKPGGLNAGVRAASGELIVFADSHQRFEPETIPRLVAALSDPRIGAVSGRLELAPGSSLVARYWAYERWLRRMEAQWHSAIGVTGAVYATRRSLWTPLPPDLLLDDVYVPMRLVLAGKRIAFLDSARAFETRIHDAGQEYARKVRTLTGVFQLCAWLPDVLVPVRNPVWLQFVFHKLMRLATPPALGVLAIWTLVRAAALLGRYTVVAAAVAVVVLAWLSRTKLASGVRVRRMIKEALLMQLAPLAAALNAVRGRWNVWAG